jgi:hypothetical protein
MRTLVIDFSGREGSKKTQMRQWRNTRTLKTSLKSVVSRREKRKGRKVYFSRSQGGVRWSEDISVHGPAKPTKAETKESRNEGIEESGKKENEGRKTRPRDGRLRFTTHNKPPASPHTSALSNKALPRSPSA